MSDTTNDLPPTPAAEKSPAELGAQRGRRVALGIFYSLVVLLTLGLAGQISVMVLSPPKVAEQPGLDCKSGLSTLVAAISSARQAAESTPASPEIAVQRYREHLEPTWQSHRVVALACEKDGSPQSRELLDAVERLRYAEESAVRRDARDLAILRQKVAPLQKPMPSP